MVKPVSDEERTELLRGFYALYKKEGVSIEEKITFLENKCFGGYVFVSHSAGKPQMKLNVLEDDFLISLGHDV